MAGPEPRSHPDPRFSSLLGEPKVVEELLPAEGAFPNNPGLPLLAYVGALHLPTGDAAQIEALFGANGWGGSWRNGVYDYHHYHSVAHEVLGCYGGSARIQLGGPAGIVLEIRTGDVVIIPAGVAHRNLGSSGDFRVVGAYPLGQRPDMGYGRAGERPAADQRVAQAALPGMDPVYGQDGPLMRRWRQPER